MPSTQAKLLKVDTVMLTGEIITHITPNHFSEKKREMIVTLINNKGKTRQARWNANTMISHK